METANRADNQLDKPDEGRPAPEKRDSQSSYPQPNKLKNKKPPAKSKVVCVKFPAQSVGAKYLKELTEPFGEIVKVLMFPCFAFVEMGTSNQAMDLVKHYSDNPTSVKGENIIFYISSTFSFLQSTRVLTFTPAPVGQDGHSDLISIAKRFGVPLYTLFLASKAFVEMKDAAEAQKLVDFYSSNTLRINDEMIKVSFSGEYSTLMHVTSAKKYEEESSSKSRTRSRSPRRRDNYSPSKRRRRSSGEKEEEKEGSERSERRTRSRSSVRSSRDGRSREKDVVPDKTLKIKTESEDNKPAPRSSSHPETSQSAQSKVEARSSSEEESDIEGMEVIGEDGENLEDEDMEILGSADGEMVAEEGEKGQEEDKEVKSEEASAKEKPEEEEKGEGNEEGPEIAVTSGVKMQEEEPDSNREPVETAEMQPEEDEEEPDFPEDLENCITLDELDEDESDDQDQKDRDSPKCPSYRVIYFRNLPQRFYTDAEFVKITKDFGKAVRYFLIRNRREGFIEMSCPSEAVRAVKELSCVTAKFIGSRITAHISNKYPRLTVGWKVQSDPEEDEQEEGRRERRSRSSRRSSKSKSSDKESSKKTSGRKESVKESVKKTPEKESVKKTPEEESVKKTPEEESVKKTPEEELVKKTPEEESVKKTPEEESVKKTPEDEEMSDMKGVCSEAAPRQKDPEKPEEIRDNPISTTDPPGPNTKQRAGDDGLEHAEVEQQAEPAGGAVEPTKPTKPVGAEFVRPVVGYFCNLCQVIYADEDEAKQEHCSSLAHYRRFQEHTGKDPWAS